MYYKELRKDKCESLDKDLFLLKPMASDELVNQENVKLIAFWLLTKRARQLDQNFDYTEGYALKCSAKNGNRPLKFESLKLKNKALYDLKQ